MLDRSVPPNMLYLDGPYVDTALTQLWPLGSCGPQLVTGPQLWTRSRGFFCDARKCSTGACRRAGFIRFFLKVSEGLGSFLETPGGGSADGKAALVGTAPMALK